MPGKKDHVHVNKAKPIIPPSVETEKDGKGKTGGRAGAKAADGKENAGTLTAARAERITGKAVKQTGQSESIPEGTEAQEKNLVTETSGSASPEEADYFESNARNLLTTWGDRGNLLTDYADRTWAGLVSTYYKGRWELFFAAVNKAMEEGSEFDQKAFDESSKDFEYSWWKDRPGTFISKPEGNSIDIVKKIIK